MRTSLVGEVGERRTRAMRSLSAVFGVADAAHGRPRPSGEEPSWTGEALRGPSPMRDGHRVVVADRAARDGARDGATTRAPVPTVVPPVLGGVSVCVRRIPATRTVP